MLSIWNIKLAFEQNRAFTWIRCVRLRNLKIKCTCDFILIHCSVRNDDKWHNRNRWPDNFIFINIFQYVTPNSVRFRYIYHINWLSMSFAENDDFRSCSLYNIHQLFLIWHVHKMYARDSFFPHIISLWCIVLITIEKMTLFFTAKCCLLDKSLFSTYLKKVTKTFEISVHLNFIP